MQDSIRLNKAIYSRFMTAIKFSNTSGNRAIEPYILLRINFQVTSNLSEISCYSEEYLSGKSLRIKLHINMAIFHFRWYPYQSSIFCDLQIIDRLFNPA